MVDTIFRFVGSTGYHWQKIHRN